MRVFNAVVTFIYTPIVSSIGPERNDRCAMLFDDKVIPNICDDDIYSSEPRLVCGDFNSVASIAMHLKLPLRLKASFLGFQSAIGRRLVHDLEAQGFVDAFRKLNPIERAFTCFPMGSWKGIYARLDTAMASSQRIDRVLDCRVVPRTPASDHAAGLTTIEKPL